MPANNYIQTGNYVIASLLIPDGFVPWEKRKKSKQRWENFGVYLLTITRFAY